MYIQATINPLSNFKGRGGKIPANKAVVALGPGKKTMDLSIHQGNIRLEFKLSLKLISIRLSILFGSTEATFLTILEGKMRTFVRGNLAISVSPCSRV